MRERPGARAHRRKSSQTRERARRKSSQTRELTEGRAHGRDSMQNGERTQTREHTNERVPRRECTWQRQHAKGSAHRREGGHRALPTEEREREHEVSRRDIESAPGGHPGWRAACRCSCRARRGCSRGRWSHTAGTLAAARPQKRRASSTPTCARAPAAWPWSAAVLVRVLAPLFATKGYHHKTPIHTGTCTRSASIAMEHEQEPACWHDNGRHAPQTRQAARQRPRRHAGSSRSGFCTEGTGTPPPQTSPRTPTTALQVPSALVLFGYCVLGTGTPPPPTSPRTLPMALYTKSL